MTRKFNAQFLAVLASQAAAVPPVADAAVVTPSLEAADPTEGNAPDTTEHDKEAEAAHAAAEAAAAAAPAADAAAAPAADAAAAPAADAAAAPGDGVATDAPAATDATLDPAAADPAAAGDAPAAAADAAAGDTPVEAAAAVEDPIGADLTAAGAVDPVAGDAALDPAAADAAAVTDPVADTVAAADAGTPPIDAPTAEAGQGSEPQKIVIDVNVNVNGGAADAPAADPVGDAAAAVIEPTDGVVAEDPVVAPDAAVNPAEVPVEEIVVADAPVVPTEPVGADGTSAGTDATIDETSGVDTTTVDANILSEEELKVIEVDSGGDHETVKVIDKTCVDIEVIEGEMDRYEAGHRTIKAMSEVLDTSVETGGLSGDGAKILSYAMEHICEELGIKQATLGIPSMESFNSVSARVSATTLTMEDMKETAARIWAAIQKGWTVIMEWLGNFFKHLLDANQRLATRATQIQTSVKAVGDQVLNETFENPNIAKKLAAGQKVSPQIPQQLLSLNRFAAAAANTAPGYMQSVLDNTNKLMAAVKAESEDFTELDKVQEQINADAQKLYEQLSAPGGLKKDGRDPATFGLSAPGEGRDLYTSATWLGNKIVYGYVPNGTAANEGFRAGQATADVGEISPTLPVLPPKSIGDIAALVLEYTKEQAAQQAAWAKMQEVGKLALSAGQMVLNIPEGAAGKAKRFVGMLKEIRAVCAGIQQPAFAIAAGANAAALDYAAISLKTLGAKAAGEVAAAKAAAAPAAPAAAAAPAATAAPAA